MTSEERRKRIGEVAIEVMLLKIEKYNLECEPGFEITIDDIINHIKRSDKKV